MLVISIAFIIALGVVTLWLQCSKIEGPEDWL